jgi:hypothetical protein
MFLAPRTKGDWTSGSLDLSGYGVTDGSLLLKEQQGRGRIGIWAFYRRRALRVTIPGSISRAASAPQRLEVGPRSPQGSSHACQQLACSLLEFAFLGTSGSCVERAGRSGYGRLVRRGRRRWTRHLVVRAVLDSSGDPPAQRLWLDDEAKASYAVARKSGRPRQKRPR